MGSRLVNNVNSRFFDASNMLHPKTKKYRIIAYVESYDDVFFWRDVLGDFENDRYRFEIMLPSRTALTRGKKPALMNELGQGLGKSMIACVDADMDYLLQGHRETSRMIHSSPYVMHTYVYAIENFQCYAPSLHHVCVMATLNDELDFDFEGFFRLYSQTVYNLFVWLMWFFVNGMRDFSMSAFNNVTGMRNLNLDNLNASFAMLRKSVNAKMAYLQTNFPAARGQLKPLMEELGRLGVKEDNVYLYIQGHHLMENVVLPLLQPICTRLKHAREKEIELLAVNQTQQISETASYKHSVESLEKMLRRNTRFKQSEQYKMLAERIESLLDILRNTEKKE